LSFKNPLFNNQIIKREEQHIHSDLSDDDHHTQTESSKALYFVNSLCIESIKSSSPTPSQKSIIHSASRQSLQQQQQQPLFVLNNGYMTRSTQSLASSTINTPITTKNSSTSTYYCLKTNDEYSGTTKRQSILPSQQPPPKMGVKALNHTSSIKVKIIYCDRKDFYPPNTSQL
jgi:hypothetical protein